MPSIHVRILEVFPIHESSRGLRNWVGGDAALRRPVGPARRCHLQVATSSRCEQALQIAVELFDQNAEKRAESPGLHIEITGRSNQSREFPFGQGEEFSRFQHARGFETGDGALDIGPTGVLGEDGADADLKRGFTRPPVLVAETFTHQRVGSP